MATLTTTVKGFVGDGWTSEEQPEAFPDSTPGLANYNYRKPIAYTGGSGAGTDYQMVVKCYYGSGTDGTESLNGETVAKVYLDSHCQLDFSDVRFALMGSSTAYVYKRCSKTDGVSAVFAFKASDSMDSARVIYVYYGNEAAVDESSNNTFVSAPVSGVVGGWTLGEDLATNPAYDYSGNANNGAATGTTTTPSPFYSGQNAITFNGSSDVITVPRHVSLEPTNTIAFYAWIKPAALTTGRIISKLAAPANGYAILINSSTQFILQISINGTLYTRNINHGLTVNVPALITVTYDGSNIKVFRGNTQIFSEAATGPITHATSTALTIGGLAASQFYNGIIGPCGVIGGLSAEALAALPGQLTANYHDPTLIAGNISPRKWASTTLPSVSDVGKVQRRIVNLAYKINEVTNRASAAGKAIHKVATTTRGRTGYAVIITET